MKNAINMVFFNLNEYDVILDTGDFRVIVFSRIFHKSTFSPHRWQSLRFPNGNYLR